MKSIPSQNLLCYYAWSSKSDLSVPDRGWPAAISSGGYDGVQFEDPLDIDAIKACRDLGLGVCGGGRINHPDDAFRLAELSRMHNLEAATVHVGWGIEDDFEAASLIESVLAASKQFEARLYVETHRATIFQDQWRTVQFIRRFPELRFNGDFSHWYTGHEMVYGDFEQKVNFIQPVLERVCFMHGRIGNPGSMQVDVGDLESALKRPYVQHFCHIWRQVFRSHLKREEVQSPFWFAVEILPANIYYAREFGGREESDRWQQSLVVREIAKRCFAEAKSTASV